jgi:protocatechuate 3,4-dioxygenase beta subunit
MNNSNVRNLLITLGIIMFLGGSIFAGYTFLKNGMAGDVSSILPGDNKENNLNPKKPSMPGSPDPRENIVTTKLTAEQKANCNTITPQVTSGPYYVANTPALVDDNLNFTNLAGTGMYLEGTVYGGVDNATPLANAKIEIWQADDKGAYHPQSGGDYNSIKQESIALRGYVTSDDKGEFSYVSIFPGEYEGRTRHVHYRVSKEGYEAVTTQLTFFKEGDKYPAEKDSVATQLLDCQNIKNPKVEDDFYSSTFDFRLKKL